MKFSAVVLASTVGLAAAAVDPASYFPSCALPCLSSAVSSATKCGATDYACQCTTDNQSAIQGAATSCVLSACGADVAANQVLPAAPKFCAAVAAAGSSSGSTSSAASSSAAATTATGATTAAGTTAATTKATTAASTTATGKTAATTGATTLATGTTAAASHTSNSTATTSVPVTAGAAVAGSVGSFAIAALVALAAF